MKYIGKVVFGDTVENPAEPSIYEEVYVERVYRGDVLRKTVQQSNQQTINNKLTASVRLSILADRYALTHFGSIVYAEYMGQKWMVKSVDPQPPRLLLELGELYHENGGYANGD